MALDEGALDIDLLAASLRADASDLGAFVESLATKLEEAVPGRVRVQRRREGLFGPKLVRRIALDAGTTAARAARGEGGVIETRCSRLSGGIVLKNEPIDTDAWLAALGRGAGRRGAAQRAHPAGARAPAHRPVTNGGTEWDS